MDGIVVINKEKGCTSHDVVYKIKKAFGKKVGHTGTLDPNATGVLPVLIGKGTELSQFLINHDKKYVATLKLGTKTDTADGEGKVIEEKAVDGLTIESINSVLKSLIGKQKQTPPMYSAIKINGKKLYEYARSGKTVDIPAREIEIYDLKLLDLDIENKLLTYEIWCSKGTYVRTVCETIAEKLGTVGYMKELNRTMVGQFKIEDAITIDELVENVDNVEFLKNRVLTIEQFFIDKPEIKLNEKMLNLLLNGVLIDSNIDGLVRLYDDKSIFIGIGVSENGKLKRKIIV